MADWARKIANWLMAAPSERPHGLIGPGSAPALPGQGIASPWASTEHLSTIVYRDLLGGDGRAMPTRAEAMGIPAIAKARHRLASAAARCPLIRLGGAGDELDPGWLQQGAGRVSPQHRMVWTMDDLVFHGWSWGAEDRGTEAGPITAAVRGRWEGGGLEERGGGWEGLGAARGHGRC